MYISEQTFLKEGTQSHGSKDDNIYDCQVALKRVIWQFLIIDAILLGVLVIAGAESNNLNNLDMSEKELQELLEELPEIIKELEAFKEENS